MLNYVRRCFKIRIVSTRFVYVIGLHAVQLGNNWKRKIPRTAKLGKAEGHSNCVLLFSPYNKLLFEIHQKEKDCQIFSFFKLRNITIQKVYDFLLISYGLSVSFI